MNRFRSLSCSVWIIPCSLLLALLAVATVGCGTRAQEWTTGAAKQADEMSEVKEIPFVPTQAKVGVGKSSQRLDHDGVQGAVAGPAVAFFRTKEKIAFEIQIPHAMNLYKALNGYGPKSHEQFMKDIIKTNQIELPQLPPGQRYQFDVEKQELWVFSDESQ